MNSIPHVQDQSQREKALDISKSFICEAPAGSGKTELLTQRLLALLATAEKPEEILAITFTRKAAAEMRNRVVSAMKLADNDEAPNEKHLQITWQLARNLKQHEQQLAWNLLKNPQRLKIQTFDSFCSSLTRQLPLHSVLGSGLNVTEDAEEYYELATQRFLQLLEDSNPWQSSIAILLSHLDNNARKLGELLVKLLAKRDDWLEITSGTPLHNDQRLVLQEHLQHVIEDKLLKLISHFPESLFSELLTLSRYASKNLEESGKGISFQILLEEHNPSDLLTKAHHNIGFWQAISKLLLTQSGSFRKSFDKRIGFPAETGKKKAVSQEYNQRIKNLVSDLNEIPGFLEALQEIIVIPSDQYEDRQWQVLNALMTVLPRLVAELHLVFKEHSVVDFCELGLRAIQSLGDELEPSELALRLDYQIKHLLIDEFQDSSIKQIHLVKHLTRGWQANDGRTLFCVGDAMQSIYSFRSANVGLFLHSKQKGIGDLKLEPLQLSTNFRSQAGIVSWINKTFSQAFPEEADVSRGAVPYSESSSASQKESGNNVLVHGLDAENYNTEEAKCILQLIEKARATLPGSNVAILVRNRNHAAHILPLLKSANQHFRAVDLVPLVNKAIVKDLLSLTRALLHPADTLAWYSILRAPWCGLGLFDLEAIATVDQDQEQTIHTVLEKAKHCIENTYCQNITQSDLFSDHSLNETGELISRLSTEGERSLKRLVKTIEPYLANKQRMPLRQWVEACWIELGGPACFQSSEDRENAEAYFELLEKQDRNSSLSSLEQLERALKKLYAQPDPMADEKLQVMTIHKAKGLEFDTVILPSLHRKPRASQHELFLWQNQLRLNGDEELIIAPINPTSSETDPIYTYLQKENTKKEKLESCRLLYVACTRARQQLHLCAPIEEDNKGNTKPPISSSLLNLIWPFVQDNIIMPDRSAQIDSTSTATRLTPNRQPHTKLPSDWILPNLPEKNSLARFIADYDFDDQDIQLPDPLARRIGTLAHQILNQIAISSIEQWRLTYLNAKNEFETLWKTRLLSDGLPPPLLNTALKSIHEIVEKILKDKNMAWMLSGKHKECHSEFAVSVVSKNELTHYIVDLLLLDEQGTTWVIDYKTSEPDASQELQDFIESEKQNYHFIMKQYARAIRGLGYQKIKLALYFPLIQTWGYYE